MDTQKINVQQLIADHKITSFTDVDALLSSDAITAQEADAIKQALGSTPPNESSTNGKPSGYLSRREVIERSRPITRIERVRYTDANDGTPVVFPQETPVEERNETLKRMLVSGDAYGYANLADGESIPVNLDLIKDPTTGAVTLPKVGNYVRYSILRSGDVIDASQSAEIGLNRQETAEVFKNGERNYLKVLSPIVRVTKISDDLESFRVSESVSQMPEAERLMKTIQKLTDMGVPVPESLSLRLAEVMQ